MYYLICQRQGFTKRLKACARVLPRLQKLKTINVQKPETLQTEMQQP